jgi:hypothetical protein
MCFFYTSLERGTAVSMHFVCELGVCIYKIKQTHLSIEMYKKFIHTSSVFV